MKKTLMVAALTGVFATAAHAQSSVTLYGLIDAGITYTNNQGGHSNWQETSGSVNGSRWGLRGSEDLGGGLKAIFTLENGFNIANGNLGQNSREFGRQAFVGLASDQFGAVTLGRQYDSAVDYLGPLALTGTQYGGTQFAHPFDNDNLDNSFRVNNSIKFQSANYSGFKFGGLYGFSNDAGEFSNNRAYSVGASYNYGGLNVAAAYLQLNNSVGALGASTNSSGAVSGDNTLLAGRQRTFGAGLNYTFGPATAGFVYTQTNLNNFAGISSGASGIATTGVQFANVTSGHFQNFELNGRYQITPAISVAGAYTYTQSSIEGTNPKWNQFSLQTAYALSKRTDVYLQGEYQHVSQDGSGLKADINSLAASGNNNQVAVTAGLRHRF
ncbi:porin [Paraburkholderia phenazinium]|jgi:GBP family porin|uniref:Porin, GBP family n=1 Tax=Paraburkholderia phenazinium TaxID=60549 RepID=A0A1N6L0P8_9BURK|nr:porin [Paraburkholderia phenazinium]SIO62246.1 porin, GBP family [Paraburkholderia phenazinium]